MHEMSIATHLLGIVRRAARDARATQVLRVEVSIGRLRAVEPTSLAFCFEVLCEGTLAEEAELILHEVTPKGQCEGCGKTVDIRGYRLRCPRCPNARLTIIAGKELRVDRILARSHVDPPQSNLPSESPGEPAC